MIRNIFKCAIDRAYDLTEDEVGYGANNSVYQVKGHKDRVIRINEDQTHEYNFLRYVSKKSEIFPELDERLTVKTLTGRIIGLVTERLDPEPIYKRVANNEAAQRYASAKIFDIVYNELKKLNAYHGDLQIINFLYDMKGNIKLIDFTNSGVFDHKKLQPLYVKKQGCTNNFLRKRDLKMGIETIAQVMSGMENYEKRDGTYNFDKENRLTQAINNVLITDIHEISLKELDKLVEKVGIEISKSNF